MTDLFAPLTLRPGVVARNRVWLAPLTNMQSHPDGRCSDEELRFLARRAEGGFGLIETCAAHVAQDGKAWAGELGVHDDAMLPGLTRLASRLREAGTLSMVQLFHGGIRATQAVSGTGTFGPSAWSETGLDPARAASEEDLARTLDAFEAAALRCAKAGFDAVELHGAHGYLLSQFLSTTYNLRDDAWGGSLPNRARLLLEVTRRVRRAAPALALCVRLSPEDFGQARGLDLDESLEVARGLEAEGIDVLHLSLWRAERPSTKRPDQHPTTLFRAALTDRVKLVVAGGIGTRAQAEAQLALGADAVALGRAAIANPDWPALVQRGEAPRVPPLTEDELLARDLAPGFVAYMRRWPGFVV